MSANDTPLRLTWQLASPIVVGAYPLHLDALVAFALAQEMAQNNGGVQDLTATLKLPLDQEIREGKTCVKASALLPTESGEHSMRMWTRKSDPYDYAARLEAGQFAVKTKFPLKPHGIKFDTQRGTFKQMFKFFAVRHVRTVQAWCVGDMDRLAELLAPEAGLITYLGAKTRMGYGRVLEFDIQHDEMAREIWAKRVLPWPVPNGVEIEAASSLPYWEVKNRGVAYVDPALFS